MGVTKRGTANMFNRQSGECKTLVKIVTDVQGSKWPDKSHKYNKRNSSDHHTKDLYM